MAKKITFIFLSALLVFLFFYPVTTASAQDLTPDAVIAAVNALRAGGGLTPYQVDDGLVSYAQEHAEYQARINTSTHQHSDGQLPGSKGIWENVAQGDKGIITVDAVISPIWADAVHMKTMVGFTSGFMGVGVASNDSSTFITLDVRPGGSAGAVPIIPSISSVAFLSQSNTPLPFEPIITNTPQADGSIVHVVISGETLWEIALSYGLKVADILQLNGLSATSNSIFVGQKLIIRLPVTATPTVPLPPSATATRQPTHTPRPPTPTHAPTITPSPSPSAAATRAPLFTLPNMPDSKSIAYLLIGVGVAGLLVILATGFRK